MENEKLTGRQVTAELKRAEEFLHERNYDAAETVARNLLPSIGDGCASVQLRVYLVLCQVSEGGLSKEESEQARQLTEHLLEEKDISLTERVRAHLLHLIVGVLEGTAASEEDKEARARRTMKNERREFFALKSAQELLGRGSAAAHEQKDAHVLICCQSMDSEEIAPHFEAILNMGDEVAITHASLGAPVSFHRRGKLEHLNRGLALVEEPVFRNWILEKKLRTIAAIILAQEESADDEGVEEWHLLREQLLAAHTEIECSTFFPRLRAMNHLCQSLFACLEWEPNMAWFHLMAARELQEKFHLEGIEEEIGNVQEHLEETFEDDNDTDDDTLDDGEGEEWKKGGAAEQERERQSDVIRLDEEPKKRDDEEEEGSL